VIRPFWIMTVLLLGLLTGVGIHYLRFDRDSVLETLASLAEVTRHTGLSFSVAYYEPDTTQYWIQRTHSNIVYPEMEQINRMDFVYAQ